MHILDIYIKYFKGLRNFSIDIECEISGINIITGESGTGKTTFLDSIALIQSPKNLSMILNKDPYKNDKNSNEIKYYDFIKLFSREEEIKEIYISTINYSISIKGEISPLLEYGEENNYQFIGKIRYFENYGKKVYSEVIKLSPSSNAKLKKPFEEKFKMNYIMPFDHLTYRLIDNIIENKEYKEDCLELLQKIDKDIIDLIILDKKEYIQHKKAGNIEILDFGNGIARILLILNTMIKTSDGLLLIDEIENSISSNHYKELFKFFIKYCKKLKIQAFITANNSKILDIFLEIQNEKNQNKKNNDFYENFSEIYLEKNKNLIVSDLNYDGRYHLLREDFWRESIYKSPKYNIVLCDNKLDAIFLSCYLQNTCKWEYTNKEPVDIKIQIDERKGDYLIWHKKGTDYLLIYNISDEDRFAEKYWYIYHFEKVIYVINENVSDDIKSRIENIFAESYTDENGWNIYENYKYMDESIKIKLLKIVIPDEDKNMFSSRFIEFISKTEKHKLIVEKSKEFLQSISPYISDYIKDEKDLDNMLVEIIFSILSENQSFSKIYKKMKAIQWKKSKKIRKHLEKLKNI